MQFTQELERTQTQIEAALGALFSEDVPQRRLLEAMRYSLLAGGKRIRPVLTLQFCQAAGGNPQKALPFACAVEMLHTYSLIHDDLPCMDNDTLRRGKPTCHTVYGEGAATLAGDALQCAAFQTILTADLPAEQRAAAALELAKAAGPMGMCGGQQLDLEGEGRTLRPSEITQMYALKTGALLRAACVFGVIAAGQAPDSPAFRAAAAYAEALGLAFQIQDDILDATGDEAALGKRTGVDEASQKSTLLSFLGLERCKTLVAEKTQEAKAALHGVFPQTAFLEALAELLSSRSH